MGKNKKNFSEWEKIEIRKEKNKVKKAKRRLGREIGKIAKKNEVILCKGNLYKEYEENLDLVELKNYEIEEIEDEICELEEYKTRAEHIMEKTKERQLATQQEMNSKLMFLNRINKEIIISSMREYPI